MKRPFCTLRHLTNLYCGDCGKRLNVGIDYMTCINSKCSEYKIKYLLPEIQMRLFKDDKR